MNVKVKEIPTLEVLEYISKIAINFQDEGVRVDFTKFGSKIDDNSVCRGSTDKSVNDFDYVSDKVYGNFNDDKTVFYVYHMSNILVETIDHD